MQKNLDELSQEVRDEHAKAIFDRSEAQKEIAEKKIAEFHDAFKELVIRPMVKNAVGALLKQK